MDHPLRAAATLPLSVWRSAAVVAILVALVELVLLVAAGVALLTGGRSPASPAHRSVATHRAQPPTTSVAKTRHQAAAPRLARGKVHVVVLNGNGRPGAAAAGAARVRQHGYQIGKVGNAARMSYARSIVMYRPGFEGEGRRLARDLGIRLVGPLDGMRPAELHGAQAVLILGA